MICTCQRTKSASIIRHCPACRAVLYEFDVDCGQLVARPQVAGAATFWWAAYRGGEPVELKDRSEVDGGLSLIWFKGNVESTVDISFARLLTAAADGSERIDL